MQIKTVSYSTALWLALGISLLMNLTFVLMFFFGRDSVMPPEGKQFRPAPNINATMIHAALNFIVAYLLYLLNFKMFRTSINGGSKIWEKWWLVIPVTIAATILISYSLSQFNFWLTHSGGGMGPKFMRGGMTRDMFIAVIVLLSSQLIFISFKQQKTALQNQALMAENLSTRYEALKNQVDPHFLFNSLNTLNSLIKIDADKAQEYVHQLSYVFRYTLQNKQTITLEDELNFTQAYCHLMQIRYGDALRVKIDVEAKYNNYLIIPLSLQTLVENAIKHNVVSSRQPLSITITASPDETVTVRNPVQPKKEPETGAGIGLNNLRDRYRLMWHREIAININEQFEVIIPLHKPENQA